MSNASPSKPGGPVAMTIYAIGALQIFVLLIFVGQYIAGSGKGTTSGGAEMGLFFLNLVPLSLILVGLALFRFSGWRVLRAIGALVIVLPALTLLLLLAR